jgi:hypothetical protein
MRITFAVTAILIVAGEPECNGVIERSRRALKAQRLHPYRFATADADFDGNF